MDLWKAIDLQLLFGIKKGVLSLENPQESKGEIWWFVNSQNCQHVPMCNFQGREWALIFHQILQGFHGLEKSKNHWCIAYEAKSIVRYYYDL